MPHCTMMVEGSGSKYVTIYIASILCNESIPVQVMDCSATVAKKDIGGGTGGGHQGHVHPPLQTVWYRDLFDPFWTSTAYSGNTYSDGSAIPERFCHKEAQDKFKVGTVLIWVQIWPQKRSQSTSVRVLAYTPSLVPPQPQVPSAASARHND